MSQYWINNALDYCKMSNWTGIYQFLKKIDYWCASHLLNYAYERVFILLHRKLCVKIAILSFANADLGAMTRGNKLIMLFFNNSNRLNSEQNYHLLFYAHNIAINHRCEKWQSLAICDYDEILEAHNFPERFIRSMPHVCIEFVTWNYACE